MEFLYFLEFCLPALCWVHCGIVSLSWVTESPLLASRGLVPTPHQSLAWHQTALSRTRVGPRRVPTPPTSARCENSIMSPQQQGPESPAGASGAQGPTCQSTQLCPLPEVSQPLCFLEPCTSCLPGWGSCRPQLNWDKHRGLTSCPRWAKPETLSC